MPDPWARVNFSYGNRDVTATIIIAARRVTEGDSYFNPPRPARNQRCRSSRSREITTDHLHMKLDVGAFSNTLPGQHGRVRLGPLRHAGHRAHRRRRRDLQTGIAYDYGDATFLAEVGLMGQLNKAPLGVEPAGWNGYLDPNVGWRLRAARAPRRGLSGLGRKLEFSTS